MEPAPNGALVGYMVVVVALAIVAHATPALDFRGVGRVRRRPVIDHQDGVDGLELGPSRDELDRQRRRLETIMILPRADLALLATLAGLFGLLLAAALGALGPRLMAFAFHGGFGPNGPELPPPLSRSFWVGPAPLERLAQLVGAAAIAVLALRLYRPFAGLGVLAATLLALRAAVDFVLDRPFGGY